VSEIANTTGNPERADLTERINAEHRACGGAVRSAVDHAINAGGIMPLPGLILGPCGRR